MKLLGSLSVAQSIINFFILAATLPSAEAEPRAFIPSIDLKLPYDLEDTSAMVKMALKRPSVVLENLPSFSDVRCADGNVIITFANAEAVRAARAAWPSSGNFLVIMSESPGSCSGDHDRGFFLLGELTHDEDKFTVTAPAEKRRPRDEIGDAVIDFSQTSANTRRRQRSSSDTTPTPTVSGTPSRVVESRRLPLASQTFKVDLSNTTFANFSSLYLRAERALFSSTIQLDGHVHFNPLEMELRAFYIQIRIDYELDLNVTARIKSRAGIDILQNSPLSASIAAIDIPGIIKIGPMAAFTIGVELAAEGPVNVTAGYHSLISGATARLDLLQESGTRAHGWEPVSSSGFANVSAQVSLQLNPFADLSVGFGINILEGKVDMTAGIAARSTLVNGFVIGSSFEHQSQTGVKLSGPKCPDTQPRGSCCVNAAWYESRFWFEIRAFVTQFYLIPLYRVDVPIYKGECWPFEKQQNTTKVTTTAPVGNKNSTQTVNQTETGGGRSSSSSSSSNSKNNNNNNNNKIKNTESSKQPEYVTVANRIKPESSKQQPAYLTQTGTIDKLGNWSQTVNSTSPEEGPLWKKKKSTVVL